MHPKNRKKTPLSPSPRPIAVKWDGNNDTYSSHQTGRRADGAPTSQRRGCHSLFSSTVKAIPTEAAGRPDSGGCSSRPLPETSQPNLSALGIKAPETIRLVMANSTAVRRQHNRRSPSDLSLCAGPDESASSPAFSFLLMLLQHLFIAQPSQLPVPKWLRSNKNAFTLIIHNSSSSRDHSAPPLLSHF